MKVEPQNEHHWLHKLVGSWESEMECNMGPDQPAMKTRGTEVVRSLGGLWTVGEGECHMPEGGTGQTMMSLGYDPATKRFVGSFIASMMFHLWQYNGSLDADGKILTLDTEGPSMTGDGLSKYQDMIEFVTADHRTLRSQILGADGMWVPFMKADYRRKPPA